MQTYSSIKDSSKQKRRSGSVVASAASDQMRWKLYNNPYYYASDNDGGSSVILADSTSFHKRHRDYTKSLRHYCYAQKAIEKFQCYATTKEGTCKDVCNGMPTTSRRSSTKRIYKAVRKNADRFCLVGDTSILVDALQKELQKVWVQVQELEEACIWARMEINNLQLRVENKGKSWPSKVYAKFAAKALLSKEDSSREEQSQQQLQSHIKKLEKHLAESKTALIKAKKDILHERKAKELLQLICAELSHGIGQDKLEIDEQKQDNIQITHQAEVGRKILLKREAWREEKVQVKLTEAKFEVARKSMSNLHAFEDQMKYFLAATTRKN